MSTNERMLHLIPLFCFVFCVGSPVDERPENSTSHLPYLRLQVTCNSFVFDTISSVIN